MPIPEAEPQGSFSPGLRTFMWEHPRFRASLKLADPDRFLLLPGIIVSRQPPEGPHPEDEVLGMWYLDKVHFVRRRRPFFKQDFVVNVEGDDTTFVSYSASNVCGPYVLPLRVFFSTYGDGKRYYHRDDPKKFWVHHYDGVDDLPDIGNLRELGRRAKEELQ